MAKAAGLVTVTFTVPGLKPSFFAEITAAPAYNAVTLPVWSTEATLGSLLSQVTPCSEALNWRVASITRETLASAPEMVIDGKSTEMLKEPPL